MAYVCVHVLCMSVHGMHACMIVCLCMACMHAGLYVHLDLCLSVHACVCACLCLYVHIHVSRLRTHTHARAWAHKHRHISFGPRLFAMMEADPYFRLYIACYSCDIQWLIIDDIVVLFLCPNDYSCCSDPTAPVHTVMEIHPSITSCMMTIKSILQPQTPKHNVLGQPCVPTLSNDLANLVRLCNLFFISFVF